MCHLKMENYGFAIVDADRALKANPSFVKAYYRKGTAFLMIAKYDDARDAFKLANKLTGGKDKDILEKLNQIKKVIYEREFFKSIAIPDETMEPIDITQMEVPSSYTGPRIDDDEQRITVEWCLHLMNYMKDQNKLHKKYAIKLLWMARDVLKQLLSVVEQPIPEYLSSPSSILVRKHSQSVATHTDSTMIYSTSLN